VCRSPSIVRALHHYQSMATAASLEPVHVVAGAGQGRPNTFACGVFRGQTIIVRAHTLPPPPLVSSPALFIFLLSPPSLFFLASS
jgi:hypothetical protein